MPFSGNKSSSSVDLYEASFSLAPNMTTTSCCSQDQQLLNVTCGRGLSCAGQCSALAANLCPTGNCTGDPQDCEPTLQVPEDTRGRGYVASANLPSWVFSWCPSRCKWVRYYPACCFNPNCFKKKRRLCRWLANYIG